VGATPGRGTSIMLRVPVQESADAVGRAER